MKLLVLFLIEVFVVIGFFTLAQANKSEPCNQIQYDKIYHNIINDTFIKLNDSLTKQQISDIFELRNATINELRLLCKGQLSKYERGEL